MKTATEANTIFHLKQSYLFLVFRMMSEDGGGGRSKVS